MDARASKRDGGSRRAGAWWGSVWRGGGGAGMAVAAGDVDVAGAAWPPKLAQVAPAAAEACSRRATVRAAQRASMLTCVRARAKSRKKREEGGDDTGKVVAFVGTSSLAFARRASFSRELGVTRVQRGWSVFVCLCVSVRERQRESGLVFF
jgi:hypothetical protein